MRGGAPPKSIFCLTPNPRRAQEIRRTLTAEIRRTHDADIRQTNNRVSEEAAKGVVVGDIGQFSLSWLRAFGSEVTGVTKDFTVWGRRRSEAVIGELLSSGAYRHKIFDGDVPDILRWHSLRRSRMRGGGHSGSPGSLARNHPAI